MIKEDYCSYEVAKLLEEKGFDEPCRAVYEEKVLRINTLCDYLNSELSSYVCAPTHQMAMKWLREVHNIYLWVQPHQYDYAEDKASKFVFCLYQGDNYDEPCKEDYLTYEEAVEAALKYCLENLI